MTKASTPQVVRSYLGDPAFIAAEARAGAAPKTSSAELALPRASEQRWYVVVTALLLEFGGLLVPLAGWVAGIMLLWASSLWTRREKLVAMIVPPAVGIVLFFCFSINGSGFAWLHALVLGAIAGPALASIVIGIILSRRGWFRARA